MTKWTTRFAQICTNFAHLVIFFKRKFFRRHKFCTNLHKFANFENCKNFRRKKFECREIRDLKQKFSKILQNRKSRFCTFLQICKIAKKIPVLRLTEAGENLRKFFFQPFSIFSKNMTKSVFTTRKTRFYPKNVHF